MSLLNFAHGASGGGEATGVVATNAWSMILSSVNTEAVESAWTNANDEGEADVLTRLLSRVSIESQTFDAAFDDASDTAALIQSPRFVELVNASDYMRTKALASTEMGQYNKPNAADLGGGLTGRGQLSVAAQASSPKGGYVREDGSRAYMIGSNPDKVFSYTMATPGDMTTGTKDTFELDVSAYVTNGSGVHLSPDGRYLFVSAQTTRAIHRWTLAAPWELSTASYDHSWVSAGLSEINDFVISHDGLYLILLDGVGSDAVRVHNMPEPWVLTGTPNSAISDASVASFDADMRGITISKDGLYIYLAGDQFNRVSQMNLLAPYDLTGWTRAYNMATSGESSPQALSIINGGSRLAVLGGGERAWTQYDTTPITVDRIVA